MDYASGIWLLNCSKLAIDWKNGNDVIIFWHDVIVKLFWRSVVLSSSLFTGPSFMSISSLVLVLWQFSFIRDWPEIRKLEIPPSGFCPISGDWDKLGTQNLARMFQIKCYRILQNTRVTALPFLSYYIKTNRGGRKSSETQIRVNTLCVILLTTIISKIQESCILLFLLSYLVK